MRIFLVCYRLDGKDAQTTHIVELFKNLKKKCEVICFASKSMGAKFQEIVNIPVFNKGFFKPLSHQLVVFFYLVYYYIKLNPDVIYVRHSTYNFSPLIVSMVFKVPCIIEINGLIISQMKLSRSSGFFIVIAKFIEKFNYKYAEKIIAVTKGIKKELKKAYNIPDEKIIVIENGANTNLFTPIDQKKKLCFAEGVNYVCFVGNLAPWQGIEYFIQSTPLILKEIPNTHFLIVGDGQMKEELIGITAKTGVSEKFIFTGAVPYEDVPKYINSSDVCVAPFIKVRNMEIGLSPLKIYEYASCGKSIVSSRIPNLEFLEQNNAGILIEPENPEELAKAIIKLLKNENLREEMGRNGREYVVKNHSWEAVARRVADVCESTVRERKNRKK